MNQFLHSRKLRQGAAATVTTLLVVAVIIVFNVLISALGSRYNLQLDLTADRVYSLSAPSLQVLDQLEQDVEIYVLNNEQSYTAGGDYYRQIAEILKRYDLHSDRVQVTFIDYMRNPGFSERYPGLTLNSVLMVAGDEVHLLLPEDFFNIQADELGVYITSSKAEQTVTSTILSMTSSEVTSAVLTMGHNESNVTGLVELLVLNNFNLMQVNLASQTIPADTSLLVIAAPQADFSEAELQALDRFLYNDGRYGRTVFYLAAIDQPELPNLSAFLADWGISVLPGNVFETDYSRLGGNSRFLTVADYAEDTYSRVVQRSALMVYMPNARPLAVLGTPGVTVSTLLEFSPGAGIRSPETFGDASWSPSSDDIVGPIPALLLSTRTTDSGAELRSQVLVAATSLAVDSDIIAMPNYTNGRYFLTLLSTLCEREDAVIIEPRQLGSEWLGITYEQALTWGVFFAVVLPIMVLVVGGVVYFHRRHL